MVTARQKRRESEAVMNLIKVTFPCLTRKLCRVHLCLVPGSHAFRARLSPHGMPWSLNPNRDVSNLNIYDARKTRKKERKKVAVFVEFSSLL